jgi:hypothetical protein
MASNTYHTTCPNCEQPMETCSVTKPFDTISHQCYCCGFVAYTVTKYQNLQELNASRMDVGYPLLSSLKKQDKEYAMSPLLTKKQFTLLQEAVSTFLQLGDENDKNNIKYGNDLDEILKIIKRV